MTGIEIPMLSIPKVALVTGGNSGIGKATAARLAAMGSVVVVGYNSRRAQAEEVARTARQSAVEQALHRLQTAQESYAAVAEGTNEAALTARDQLTRQHQFSQAEIAARRSSRNAYVSEMMATDYSWIVNPPLYTRWAAAARPRARGGRT